MNPLERALLQRVLELEERLQAVENGNLELQREVERLRECEERLRISEELSSFVVEK